MLERGKVDSYSVYLEGARAPLELNTTTSNLEGHTVAIKYNPASSKLSLCYINIRHQLICYDVLLL